MFMKESSQKRKNLCFLILIFVSFFLFRIKMTSNPWEVESIQDFYFLRCPECDFDTKEENSFENHAAENHPLSFVLFDNKSAKIDFYTLDIKEEPFSQFDTQTSHDNQKSSVNDQFSPSSSVAEDNSLLVVPDLKKDSTEELYLHENDLEDYEIKIKNSIIENYSTDVEEDPLNSDMMSVHEETKQNKSFHKEIKPFKCIICNFETSTNKNLKKHMKSVHEEIKPFKCKLCDYETASNFHLKLHINSVHEWIKPFKCSKCDSSFSQKDDMKIHVESVHEGIKPFKCNICNFETSTDYNLKKHKESVHEGLKPFKCTICDYKTARNFHLKLHINSVHERIKPFKCSICDSSFSQKGDMKKHVESVHERIKPFKCIICDFRSAKKCNLKKHIESVHEDFKCKICEYKTAEKKSLRIHMKSVHVGTNSYI